MKLRDWLPHEVLTDDSLINGRIKKHLDVDIHSEYQHRPFPQRGDTYRYIHNWVLLTNGYALGWNESPRHGWTFVLSTPNVVKRYG